MKSTSVNKVLLAIIVVLLITNIVMLFMFVVPADRKPRWQDNNSGRDSGLAPVLREKAGFTEKQIADYLEMRDSQLNERRKAFSSLRSAKEKFYNTLYAPGGSDDSTVMSLADSIALQQKNVDLMMRNYFLDIRKLCTSEQIVGYDTVMKKVLTRMIGRPPKNKATEKK